ncbi:MAG: HEAT repeat domain-containing protein [Candidatus Eiseniibacteriota bacterium]|nr:MAG: HEAT repeat domain-containing protein [Candidatus Eisenbacteria bacterium]
MSEQDVQLSQNWKKVCEIATSLARTYKSRQLYAANNPVRRTCLETAMLNLSDFLKENDTLTFSVNETQLIYHERAVYANPDRRESFVFRLYRDGIRSISFHAGIDEEELEEFVEALTQVSPEAGEGDTDVVTQIWERDLVHITYLAVDDCLDLDDEEFEFPTDTPSTRGEHSISTATGEERIGIATMVDTPLTREEKQSVANVSLSEKDLEEIGHQVLLEEQQKPREKVTEIFLEILLGRSDVDVKTDVARGLGILCGDLLEEGNPVRAAEILRAIKKLLGKEGKSCEELERVAISFLEMRAYERELSRVEPRLEQADVRELEQYEGYLRELLPGAVGQLCAILGRARSRTAREMLCRVLSVLARDNLKALAQMLDDPRWYLVRNLVVVLRLMKDRRALPYLEGLLSHEEARVRVEVVQCLAEIGGTEAVTLMARCLRDRDEAIRIMAARKLGRLGGEQAASSLAACIREGSFAKRSLDEKREYFDALGRSCSDEYIPFLEGVLKKRSFLHAAEIDEMRRCAAMALARMGTERATRLLEQLAKARRGKARKYCIEALRLRRAVSPQTAGSQGPEEALDSKRDAA